MGFTPQELLKVAYEKRILNEFGAKILNEDRMDVVEESRRTSKSSEHVDMQFNCECDDHNCEQSFAMSTEEYKHLHARTNYFIVAPNHVRKDIEEVISTFPKYVLVGKYFPHMHIRPA